METVTLMVCIFRVRQYHVNSLIVSQHLHKLKQDQYGLSFIICMSSLPHLRHECRDFNTLIELLICIYVNVSFYSQLNVPLSFHSTYYYL